MAEYLTSNMRRKRKQKEGREKRKEEEKGRERKPVYISEQELAVWMSNPSLL